MATHSVYRRLEIKKRSKKKAEIDRLIYLAVIIGPLLTLPQVYSIWVQDQKGVSVISWAAYLVVSLIWLIYGIKHRDKPIITVEIAWITLELLIIIGITRLK
ncbi:MAG TPA: hypothetical protein VMR45_00360 [Patescibacteria group bacterium]|nr:hypothetical protein [Patescibacteria group bacterium]